jgi:hypothetical protein
MGMRRSPHRRRRPPKLPNHDYIVPFGKSTRTPHSNGLKPGDRFRDPKGKIHVVPDKAKGKKKKGGERP